MQGVRVVNDSTNPIPVDISSSGEGLTNTELRATPVPVSSTTLASAAKQDTGNASLTALAGVAGTTADAAVVSDTDATSLGFLRGLVKIFASVWDSTNGWFKTRAQTTGAFANQSGTITAGAAAQNAVPANASRRFLTVRNPATAALQGITTAETLWYNLTGTATQASPSKPLDPGDEVTFEGSSIPSNAVSVIAATTAHKYTIWEG